MSTSTISPLVWNHWRKVNDAIDLGGVIHYHDQQSQSIFLEGGISTRVSHVPKGHWRESTSGPKLKINNDGYKNLRFDHVENGLLYGVASNGSELTFLRYAYGLDISELATNWSTGEQVDNEIEDFQADILNLGRFAFADESTLFQPGARIILSIRIGGGELYPMGVHWLDESNYDVQSETISISGRNTIGYYLKDQTFDDYNVISGTRSSIIKAIFDYAEVPNYMVQEMPETSRWTYKPEQTLLEGLQEMIEYYTRGSTAWRLAELPDGKIIMGNESWVSRYLPRSRYSFDENEDLFKRKTSRVADGAYTSIRVTGVDSDFNDLLPITLPIKNFVYWGMGKHKTNHISAPGIYTQETLNEWALSQQDLYQYVGIGESFTGPFRPNLIVGDIAEVVYGSEGTSLGLVTSINQKFSLEGGYQTDFNVDSGGVMTEGDDYVIYSRATAANGYNRKQQIIDLVRLASKD